MGVGREPGRAALGIFTLPGRVAATANRMTIRWEVKREKKGLSPILASEVFIFVSETQSFALDQRVGQRSINGPFPVSPAGEKLAGISIRSPLLRRIRRGTSCAFGPDYNTRPKIVKSAAPPYFPPKLGGRRWRSRFIEHPCSTSPGTLCCSWLWPAGPTEPGEH